MKNSALSDSLRALIRPAGLIGRRTPPAASLMFLFPTASALMQAFAQAANRKAFFENVFTDTAMRCFCAFCAGGIVSLLTAAVLLILSAKGTKVRPADAVAYTNASFFFPFLMNLIAMLLACRAGLDVAVLFGVAGDAVSLIPFYEVARILMPSQNKRVSGRALAALLIAGTLRLAVTGTVYMMF